MFLFESTQIPLSIVNLNEAGSDSYVTERTLANTIDPTTGEPYEDGLILSGIFADLKQVPNNNNRIYDIPTYLKYVEALRDRIFSARGLYGEFEHPKNKYTTHGPNVSHKILDIFYIPEKQLVCGTIMIMNTPNGKIAKEVVKSGGCVCISARAGGSVEKGPNGIDICYLSLLATFDIVMNPGFNTAELKYGGTAEDYQLLYEGYSKLVQPISINLNESERVDFNTSYGTYLSNPQNLEKHGSFMQWYQSTHQLELDEDEQAAQQKLQDNQMAGQDKAQAKLSKAVAKELNEADNLLTNVDKLEDIRKKLKRQSQARLSGALFDGSAGFEKSSTPTASKLQANNFAGMMQAFEDESDEIIAGL